MTPLEARLAEVLAEHERGDSTAETPQVEDGRNLKEGPTVGERMTDAERAEVGCRCVWLPYHDTRGHVPSCNALAVESLLAAHDQTAWLDGWVSGAADAACWQRGEDVPATPNPHAIEHAKCDDLRGDK